MLWGERSAKWYECLKPNLDGGIWTRNLLNPNQALCQIEPHPENRRQRDQQAAADNSFNYIFFNLPYPQCLIVLWVCSGIFYSLLADMAFTGLHALSEVHCMKTLTCNCISLKPLLRISWLWQSVPRVEKTMSWKYSNIVKTPSLSDFSLRLCVYPRTHTPQSSWRIFPDLFCADHKRLICQ